MSERDRQLLKLVGIDDIDGLTPELLLTILSILGAVIKLIRNGGDAASRLEALMTAAEAVKAALDREKFPDESTG